MGDLLFTDFKLFNSKTAAISLFMERIGRNSGVKLLLPSPFEPRGRFWVLFVRLFVILDTASSKHWALPAGTPGIDRTLSYSASGERSKHWALPAGTPGIDRTLSYSASGERSKLLCLWTDLHEIWNLSFFRRALLNRVVIFEFCLFVCLLSWTQLNCFLIDFDFLSLPFRSNQRYF